MLSNSTVEDSSENSYCGCSQARVVRTISFENADADELRIPETFSIMVCYKPEY